MIKEKQKVTVCLAENINVDVAVAALLSEWDAIFFHERGTKKGIKGFSLW